VIDPSGEDSFLIRRLALEKLQELRQAGLSYEDIHERYRNVPPDWERTQTSPEFAVARDRSPRTDSLVHVTQRTDDAMVFLRTLDALEQGVAFFDVRGNLVYLNRTFRRMMAGSTDATHLTQELNLFAMAMSGVVQLRQLKNEHHVQQLARRQLHGQNAHYHLKSSFIGLDLFGEGPSILISLERQMPEMLCDEDLRSSFGLTKTECRVTRLLVEGKSNASIARDLFISPHTARTHVQRILAKMGARSRAEAAARVLGRPKQDEGASPGSERSA